MKEGICVFSGHEVPKGTGLVRVTNDTKTFLFMNRKVRALSDRKANPRAIKWTQSSRLFYKKGTKKVAKKVEKLRVFKEIRGFPSIPKSMIINKAEKKAEEKKKNVEGFRKQKKVTKEESRRRK